MTTREQIFTALFGLISTGEGLPSVPAFTFGSGRRLEYTSRRVRMWDNLPVKPALCQMEAAETYGQGTNLPYRRTYTAEWWFFHEDGLNNETAVPTITDNQILDAIDAIIAPSPSPYQDSRQTLGGLVHHCFIDGTIIKVAGDIEGQALVCVPITLLIP